MKAARWHGAKDIRVEEVPEPEIKPGFVKVDVAAAGICGSDLHEYIAGPILIPTAQEHPLSQDKAPLTMGHEYCGVVTEIGDGVTNVSVGDRVAIEPIYAIADSKASLAGYYNLDENLGFMGLSGGHAGFADVSMVPARMVHRMPDSLPMEQGALVEPAAVALHAIRNSKIKAGDKAAVFGSGPIGLLVIESLRIAGASEIYVVEPSENRRKKALELGATAAFDPTDTDPVAAIQEASDGGVNVAFEVTGVPSVLQQTIDCTTFLGQIIIVSIWETDASFQPNTVVLRERELKGTICYRNVYPAVMALMEQGYYAAEKLVTKRIGLDDIVSEGFETLTNEKTQIKILVEIA